MGDNIGIWFAANHDHHARGALGLLIKSLASTLHDIQGDVPLSIDGDPPKEGKWLVVGAHRMQEIRGFNGGRFVVFNTEHHASGWLNEARYLAILATAARILDYAPNNLETRGLSFINQKLRTVVPQIHERHCVSEMRQFRLGAGNKPIDALFVGSPSPRRDQAMVFLRQSGIACVYGFDIYGEKLQDLIDSSKVCLNIHYYMPPVRESIRIMDFVARGATYLDETDVPIHEWVERIRKHIDGSEPIVNPIQPFTMDAQLKAALEGF